MSNQAFDSSGDMLNFIVGANVIVTQMNGQSGYIPGSHSKVDSNVLNFSFVYKLFLKK